MINVVCFRDSFNKLLIKEVAVISLGSNHVAHWMATAPYPFSDLPMEIQVHNNFLTSTHMIEWFEGDIPLRHVHANLRWIARSANKIFVCGAEKAALIQNIVARHVENLEDFGCPSPRYLPKIDSFCWFHGIVHKEMYICALNDAVKLKKWMTTNTLFMESLNTLRQTRVLCTPDCTECFNLLDSTRYVSTENPIPTRKIVPLQNQEIRYNIDGYFTAPETSTTPENGYSTDPGCTTTIKSSLTGCFSCRSHPEGVDQTDGDSS